MKVLRLALIIFLVSAGQVRAAEEAVDGGAKPEVHYYDLDPNIITNYQKPPSRKLGFVTIDVQFQVGSIEALDELEYHKPLVEHTLIDVVNALDEQTLMDISQRGSIRNKIRQRVAQALKEETGKELVQDVLLTKFIYQ